MTLARDPWAAARHFQATAGRPRRAQCGPRPSKRAVHHWVFWVADFEPLTVGFRCAHCLRWGTVRGDVEMLCAVAVRKAGESAAAHDAHCGQPGRLDASQLVDVLWEAIA